MQGHMAWPPERRSLLLHRGLRARTLEDAVQEVVRVVLATFHRRGSEAFARFARAFSFASQS